VGEGSEVMISSVIASKVLELEVLFSELGSCVWAQSDEAVGQLGGWGVGAASKSESSSSNLHIYFSLDG
jgi:hypothetical protein